MSFTPGGNRSAFLLPMALHAVVLAALAWSFLSLHSRHRAQEAAARSSILLSAVPDDLSDPAVRLAHRAGIRIVPLRSPEGSALAKSAGVGQGSALVLVSSVEPMALQSPEAMEEVLAPALGGGTRWSRGAWMALALLAVWSLGAAWWRKLAYFGAIWPALGALALVLLLPACRGCAGAPGWLTLGGTASFAAIFLALGFVRKGSPALFGTVLLLSAGAGVLQALLIHSEPKLCTACMAAGLAACGSFCAAKLVLAEPSPRFIVGRSPVALLAAAGAVLLSARPFFGAPPARIEPISEKLAGQPAALYLRSLALAGGKVLLVTLPGCAACDLARRALSEHKVPFVEVPYCSLLQREGCFERLETSTAPMILYIDKKGVIQFVHTGWSEDPAQNLGVLGELDAKAGGKGG